MRDRRSRFGAASYELNHNSFQMSCELTHFISNSEFEFKELLRENDGINVNSTQKWIEFISELNSKKI